MAYMHRGVISSTGDLPPGIGGYLGALAAILRFLLSVRGLCNIGGASAHSVVEVSRTL